MGVDFFHIQALHGLDDLLQLRTVEAPGCENTRTFSRKAIRVGMDVIPASAAKLLLSFGIHLCEEDVGVLVRRRLVDGRELAARATPFGPEIHQDNVIALNGRCELFSSDVNCSHASTVRDPARDVPWSRPLFASRVTGNKRAYLPSTSFKAEAYSGATLLWPVWFRCTPSR